MTDVSKSKKYCQKLGKLEQKKTKYREEIAILNMYYRTNTFTVLGLVSNSNVYVHTLR